ncbi:MAG: beta-ketoacyl synthase N-terminal-like domain-containing protein [Candidatus Peregrinibacteria bacterium]
MREQISIIGMGQTRFGEWWGKSLKDLIEESVTQAIRSSPATSLDIDFVIVANMLGEAVNGQAHLGALTASLLPHQPPAIRVEAACASGSVAIHTAISLLESNRAGTVLVVGAEKMTDAPVSQIASALMGAAENETDAACGLTFPGLFGLIARRYMHEFGLTRDLLSLVSARHHANAVHNPFAQFRSIVAPEAVSESPVVADPLRLLDCSPVSDGAAAVLLSTKHTSPLRIAASQMSTDAVSITARPHITSFPATKDAAEHAYQEAGIRLTEISHLEHHDCFSIAALINMEDLGFAENGRGIRFYQEENLPFTVNASGGLKGCGHPVAATGIKQIIDVGKQLAASKKRWGMTHNFGGIGATCAVHILERMS